MKSSFTISAANPSDVARINEIKTVSDRFHFGPEHSARPLDKSLTDAWIPKGQILIARTGEPPAIAGFAAYDIWQGEHTLYLEQISVDPSYCRQGAATTLLSHLLAEARRRDCKFLGLTTNTESSWSAGLYKKFGFVVRPDEVLKQFIVDILESERQKTRGTQTRAYMSLELS